MEIFVRFYWQVGEYVNTGAAQKKKTCKINNLKNKTEEDIEGKQVKKHIICIFIYFNIFLET